MIMCFQEEVSAWCFCAKDKKYETVVFAFVQNICLLLVSKPFKDEAQTALFKDPVRTAL